jgi:filamentous hemagglutinin family protein
MAAGAPVREAARARPAKGPASRAEVVRLAGVVRRSRRALLLGTALQATVVLVLALPARAQVAANARPTGGAVVGGSASISRTPNATTIDQTSQRAAVNWQSFDVGARQSVNFHQPNPSAVVLNRVVGPNPSQIAGQINANGQVILQNQDGITFYKGAQVNAAGFLATAAGITNKNFMAGHMVFDQPPAPGARIVNEGHITVRDAGIAALVAPQVANSGVITARLGRIVLAGATRYTLDLYGDGLISIDVTGAVKQVPAGPGGATATALVTNTGTILAEGGQIELTARAAAGLVQELVAAGGMISAPTVGSRTGQVVLNGIGGSIVVAGALLTQGAAPGAHGGQIEVAPDGDVVLTSTARVDASGAAGGGTVAIGTDLARAAGGPSVAPTLLARHVVVAPGASIAADATVKGDGGHVTVLAGESTVMDGAISAQGGPAGGNGGFVEVSGRVLGFDGKVNVGAPQGALGSVLFDPGTLDIVNGGSSTGSLDRSGTLIAYNNPDTTSYQTVSNGALDGLTGNITLQAVDQLTVSGSIDLTAHVGQALTLDSGGFLKVNAGIATKGDISLIAADPSILNGNSLGALTINDPITTTGAVVMSSGVGGISLGALVTAASLDLTTTGSGGSGVTNPGGASGPQALNVGTLFSSGGVNGSVQLGQSNTVAALGSFAVSGGGSFTLAAGPSVAVTGPISATGVTLSAGTMDVRGSINAGSVANDTLALTTSSGTIGLDNGAVLTGTTIALDGGASAVNIGSIAVVNAGSLLTFAGTGVTEVAGGTISAGTLATAGALTGTAALGAGQNTIATLGSFAVTGGDLALASTGSLAVTGPVSATNVILSAGTMDVSGSITAGSVTDDTLAITTTAGTLGLNNGAVLAGTTIGITAAGIGVNGAVVPTTQAYLHATGAGGITFGTGGTLGATGALVGLEADAINLGSKGSIIAGTVEVAPNPGGTVTIKNSSSLDLGTLLTQGETLLRIGAVTPVGGGQTITAGSIAVNVGFGASTVALELDATGPITEGNSGKLTAANLSGVSNTGSVVLDQTNTVGTLGSFTAGGGDFSLTSTGSLAVTGPVSGTDVAINAGTLDVGGSIGATGAAGTVALGASTGTLGLNSGAILTGPTIALSSGSLIAIGSAAVAHAGSLLSLGGGQVTEDPGGTLIAPSLVGTGTFSGPVDLAGTLNAIANLGSFKVSGAAFTLVDGAAISLNVGGVVNSSATEITGPQTISISGTIGNDNGSVILSTGTGGIALTGAGAILGGGHTVGLSTTGGGIAEATMARLVAATLQSTGGVTGPIDLAGSANAIAQINGFVVTGGDFTLTEQPGQTLSVDGSISAAGHAIAWGVDALTFSGSPSLVASSIAIAPVTTGTTVTLGTGTGLVLSAADFTDMNAGRIDIGSLDGGSTVTAGAIAINAAISVAPTTALGLYSRGTIGESGAGALTTGDLTGYGALGATLSGSNTIGAIGSFSVGPGRTLDINDIVSNITLTSTGGGGTFIFTDPGGTVTLAGTLSGQSITIGPAFLDVKGTLNAGAIALDAGSTLGTAGTILLESTSALLVGSGSVELGVSPGTLIAVGAGVTQQAGGVISAGTLLSANGVSGGVDLAGSNTIASVGSFAVTSGDFVLADSGETGALTLASSLTADNVTLGGTIGVPGSIVLNGGTIALNSGGSTIALGAGSGGIKLAGTALVNAGSAGTVALGAGAGGITQSASAAIVAGTLLGNKAITGAVALVGANTIATLGSLTVTGADFTLADAGETGLLSVTGPVSAANVTIGGGTLSPGTLAVPGSIAATGSLLALSGGTGGITLGGSLHAAGTLALGAAGGGVTETGGINAGTLASLGTVTGTVDLAGSNTIGAIGGFAVTGGDFVLADSGVATLAVPGRLTADNVTLGATGIDVTGGTIALNGGTLLALNAGGGGIGLQGAALLDAGGATLSLATGNGVTQTGTGTILAGTLISGSTVSGTVDLAGTHNDIGTLGAFTVAAGDLFVTERSGVSLTVAGVVNAATNRIGLRTDTLSVPGSLIAGTIALAPTGGSGSVVTLGTGGSGLVVTTADLAQMNAGRIDIGSLDGGGSIIASAISITAGVSVPAVTTLGLYSTGAIVETSTGSLAADGLAGQAGGPVTLLGANTIGTLGAFAVSGAGNGFALADTAALTVAGAVSAPGQVFLQDTAAGGVTLAATGTVAGGTLDSVQADAFAVLANGTITGALFELAPSTPGGLVTLGGLSLSSLAGIGPSVLRIGAVTSPTAGTLTTTAGSIVVGGAFGASGIDLELDSSGGISQSAVLTAGTLSGNATGPVDLALANSIGTLGRFAANGFTLDDGLALTVNGPVTGGALAAITDTAGLSVPGTVSAGVIELTGSDLTVSGFVTDGGTGITALVATGGSIAETGTLIAGTLSGSSTGAVSLTGANASANRIATLGAFTADGFTLDDGLALTVSGPVNGGTLASITDTATLSVPGAVNAGAILLDGPSLTIGGTVTDGGTGTTTLIATAGSITETGALIVGTLSGSSSGATTLTGASASANQIATLGSFIANGFTLNDGLALSVSGPVNGGASASIVDTALLSVPGSVRATAVTLTGANLTIGGTVTDGGAGTTALIATAGSITETGTLSVGTLGGSSTGAATLTGASASANQIATLGSFTANGFTLNDGLALTLNGPVNGGASARIADTALLSVPGSVSATAISLSGANLAISGTVTDGGAGTTALVSTGGSITETGTLIVGTLSGDSSAATTLSGSNTIAALGSFTAAGFTLTDGAALTVNGPVTGGALASITDAAALSVPGSVGAGTILLSGPSLTIGGTVTDGGAGATTLVATSGPIAETGALIVGTLSGSSTGAASLTGASASANQIAILGGFTASGFTLNDGLSLTVNGPVNGGASARIADTALLSVPGSVSATAISLSGTNLTIGGTVTDGGAGTTTLVATAGAITETGSLIVGTLSGSSTGAASLTGASASANQIATLGSFTANGFTLDDGLALTVNGPVNGGSSASLADTALLSVPGSVSATAIGLSGANLAIGGTVTDGGAGTTALAATGGSITETGALIVGTLSGSSTAATTLTGSNSIATLGSFSAAGFTLTDGTALTVNGPMNGGALASITDAAALSVPGSVSAGTILLSGPSLTIGGTVTDGGAGTTTLLATSGPITETGALIVGTLSGSSTGAANLTGASASANQIAILGGFTANGFMLNDGLSLTVNGPVNGGASASIADTALLSVPGSVSATVISLSGMNLAIGGTVTDGGTGTTVLTATAGSITETGALIVGTLSGSSTGAATLTGANQVAILGGFTANGFTLNDGLSLTVNGPVNGGASASIADTALLSVPGSVNASAISLSGTNLTIGGTVTDGGAGTANLVATAGPITETGALIVGTLSGSTTGSASLTGSNAIATLGVFTAPGGLTLDDGGNLTVAGPVSAGPSAQINVAGALGITGALTAASVTLNVADLNLGGTLTGTNQVTLNIGGSVSETGGLVTPLLTGHSGGATNLTGGGNRIAEIDGYTAGSVLNVTDGEALTLTGVFNAPTMVFNATPNQITIANGTTLITGGYARPSGPAGSFAFPSGPGSPGAYFSDFVQQGVLTVTSPTGGPSIVRIDAYDGGNITLSQSGGLYGSSTWLILDLHASGALGSASGNIFVRWLDVVFPPSTSSGGADLSGTVGGIGGQAGAGVGHPDPSADPRFRLNACAIGSVNCVVLPVEVLPLANPLQEFSIGSFFNPEQYNDLFLPLVSRRDY